MLGAITGDIIGSIYEFNNIKTKDFELFGEGCTFTDDTVLTVAVADWLLCDNADLADRLAHYTYKYPSCSYGGMYMEWVNKWDRQPYDSYGNGSAMRVSAAAWVAKDRAEALELARSSAKVTHSHPEGIKGAQATALAIWLGREGADSERIRQEVTDFSGYDLTETVDDIREWYYFNETCQKTVPQAIICALDADDYEDAIRNAISIGGDSDTVAAITGSIAEAMFGIPGWIETKARSYLPMELSEVVDQLVDCVGEKLAKDKRVLASNFDAKKHRVEEWLADNITVIREVKSILLCKFTWEPDQYGGRFNVAFDGVEHPDSFMFSLGGSDGYTDMYIPMFHSPLGVPASFEAIRISPRVERAIKNEIRTLFPRIEPFGLNRKTMKETVSGTPIHERLPDPDALLKTVATISDSEFKIRIDVGSLPKK
jgi:ADP-ribosyl-[dinitrogen reductase] hydrolase